MAFDGPVGVLMQPGDAGQDDQQNDALEPAIFFVNIREPLKR